jgi:hypothetical protein
MNPFFLKKIKIQMLSRFLEIQVILLCSLLFCSSDSALSKKNETDFYAVHNTPGERINTSFTDENSQLSHDDILNAQIAASGDTVVKLNRKYPYGLTRSIYDFYENEYFHISVWRFGGNDDGVLVADGFNDSQFYACQNKPELVRPDGWQLITLDIHIPPQHKFSELRIYVWNKGKRPISFRDLTIERKPQKIYPEFDQLALKINTDDAAVEKLEAIRQTAFEKGILETGEDDYVKAQLIYGIDTLKASIRLKGDWLDHLVGFKWSFRVKMRKEDSWKNMRSFSMQSPETRGFLDEWFAHKIFASQDVLTTRYGFVPVIFNGKSLGIYAYEEHFDKQLVEANHRREGPILKYSEEIFWNIQKFFIAEGKTYNVPFFEACDIIPFKSNRTLNDKLLYNEFLIAQNLLYQFKYNLKPVSEIFDINSLAKFYALSDITKAYHGFIWHNIRFYYNPVISRLEPVAFDCYTASGAENASDNIIFEMAKKSKISTRAGNLLILPFSEKDFVDKYIHYLDKYSRENFLDSLYSSCRSEIDSLVVLIKKEFKYYYFDLSSCKNKCEKICKYLDSHKTFANKPDNGTHEIEEIKADKELPDDIIPFLIKIYKSRKNTDSVFYVKNFYADEIRLFGYGDNDSILSDKIDGASIPVGSGNYQVKIGKPDSAKYLFFKIRDREKSYAIPVFGWDMPRNYAPFQELSEKYKIENQTLLKLNEKALVIEGKLDIAEPLIIPGGYQVIIKPGTELNFINHSTFISFSPVYINGTIEQPVNVISSDGTAMGFNVLQSPDKSVLKNVVIDQFNTLDYNDWTLTGAVNFYDSDVELINVTIKNNRCEDALNIIRSDFLMTGCVFDNIFADAFDSDFSNGTLTNCQFRDIANDATDFSGSKVTITDCEINNAGDKAISCGEESEIMVENIRINKANIAVASKDLSRLTISNSLIFNSNYSYVAFRKKPEFGEAEIHAINNTIMNITSGQIIEQGSVIYINDKLFTGTDKDVAGRFYIN